MYILDLPHSFHMWFLKVRQLSSKTPKYFTQSVCGRFWRGSFRLGKLSFCSFLLVVKNENLVSLSIPILSESLLAGGQFSRDLTLLWLGFFSIF